MLNFLSPYFSTIKLAMYAIAGLALFGAGYALSNHFAQGKIDTINQSLGEYKSAYASLSETTSEQNDAINKLNQDAADREKVVMQAQERAKSASKLAQRRSASILTQRRPAGVNLCEAASQAFDDELRSERGVK